MISYMVDMLKLTMGWSHVNLIVVMCMRGFILYGLGLFFIRLNKKLLGIPTFANFILFAMLGSISAAAITSEELFLPIIVTIFILSLINRVISMIVFHYPRWERLFIGSPVLLVANGQIQWNNIQKHLITRNDLLNALQSQLHTNDFSHIDSVYLATDGTINFIKKQSS